MLGIPTLWASERSSVGPYNFPFAFEQQPLSESVKDNKRKTSKSFRENLGLILKKKRFKFQKSPAEFHEASACLGLYCGETQFLSLL